MKKHYLYGKHAVHGALNNNARKKYRLFVTKGNQQEFSFYKNCEIVAADKITSFLPEGAVHQGVALEVELLSPPALEDVLITAKRIVMLDQITDPHNIGAILRSSAAFGVDAMILPEQHSPQTTPLIAKIACGALELVPIIYVKNFSRCIKASQEAGFWSIGLDGEAKDDIRKIDAPEKTLLIIGAEGKGMRRLTREHCDILTKIPIASQMESLNASNAAAIALFSLIQ